MQLFKGLVTLGFLITGCATGRYADLRWAEMAARAGDQAELQEQLKQLQKANPEDLEPFLLAMRLGAPPSAVPSQHKHLLTLATTSRTDLLALARELAPDSPLRRPVMRALLKAGAVVEAERLTKGNHEQLLIALERGDPVTTQRLLVDLGKERQPSDTAVRDLTTALRQLEPAGTPASRKALEDLAVRRSAGKALQSLKGAPEDDCLAAIVGGLALEELDQPAAATQRLEAGKCVTSRAHWARLGFSLSPQEARLVLEQMLEAAPLNRTALETALTLYGPDHPLHLIATQRLAAWVPDDRRALAAIVEREQREGRWLAAAGWIDRSLRFAWDEVLHAQALRLMARAGADKRGHPRQQEFRHRLEWLRSRRPELAQAIDQVVAGNAPPDATATP